MVKRLIQACCVCLLSLSLFACYKSKTTLPTNYASYLQQAGREFNAGHYKNAKLILYPLACDGVPQAEYALGYMYYYGYGVPQDTDVGYFWIKRAADKHYAPAMKAAHIIDQTNPSPRFPG